MAYRSFSLSGFEARGVRKVTTLYVTLTEVFIITLLVLPMARQHRQIAWMSHIANGTAAAVKAVVSTVVKATGEVTICCA